MTAYHVRTTGKNRRYTIECDAENYKIYDGDRLVKRGWPRRCELDLTAEQKEAFQLSRAICDIEALNGMDE